MKKARIFKVLIAFCVILSFFGGINTVNALEETNNVVEEVVSELIIAIGDVFLKIIYVVVGEDVTVTNLIYNKIDAFNPNFFDTSLKPTGITASVTSNIVLWYNVFKMIALAIYIVALLAIGIHILFSSTANGMAKAKELVGKWFKGLVALLFMPYVIKYAFLVNESLVGMFMNETDTNEYRVGGVFSTTEWSVEKIEFRSPEYISRLTGNVKIGSDDVNENYMSNLSEYEQNLDLMRIMRAYAGATKRLIFAIVWWIIIGQNISFIIMYYKRYFMIAFLIATYPIVCLFHGISIARGTPGKEIGLWVKEILTNIFVQFVHAIIYTMITGVCVSIVATDIQSSANLNWVLIILAINFVSEGEKILRRIIGAVGNSVQGVGKSGQGIKKHFNEGVNAVKSVRF